MNEDIEQQMHASGPITQAEMILLFGEEMPIEAVNVLWRGPDEMTVGEVRAELRRIASRRKDSSGPLACPFCGQPPFIVHEDRRWVVGCGNGFCIDVKASGGTEQQAIRAWNVRPIV